MGEMSLKTLGELIYSIPAGLILYFGHTLFHGFLQEKMASMEKEPVIQLMDFWGMGTFILFGVSWGGLISGARKHSRPVFFLSHLFYLGIILAVLLYFSLKSPSTDGYIFFFCVKMIQYSITLFVLNLIPIPPMDAALLYWPSGTPFPFLVILNTVFKLTVILFLVLGWFHPGMIVSDSWIASILSGK